MYLVKLTVTVRSETNGQTEVPTTSLMGPDFMLCARCSKKPQSYKTVLRKQTELKNQKRSEIKIKTFTICISITLQTSSFVQEIAWNFEGVK